MARATDTRVGTLVRATLAAARLGELSDGELLARFVATRDEAAFAELVRRLGPAVYGVCRRVLGNAPDAEDSFQVAFLVLARKAARVRAPGRVAAWLHGVAVLAARKARAARTRRRARETELSAHTEPTAPAAGPEPDLVGVLDEEIDRLPERYRLPVVLCEVRELTVARAAAELGWPAGTVASRLSRGRAALARRLEARGVTGAAALAAVGAVADGTAAGVPPRWVGLAIAAATGDASASAVPLLHEVVRSMTIRYVRAAVACVALGAAVAVGGVGILRPADAAPLLAAEKSAPVQSAPPAAGDPPAARPGDRPADNKVTDSVLQRVRFVTDAALLGIDEVQTDLGLTADQRRKVLALSAVAELSGGGAILTRSGETVTYEDVLEAVNSASAAVLTPDQQRRLKQVQLQANGPASLLDRRVTRYLGLTADQEDRIEAALPTRLPPPGRQHRRDRTGEEKPGGGREVGRGLGRLAGCVDRGPAREVGGPHREAASERGTGEGLPPHALSFRSGVFRGCGTRSTT